MANNTAYTILTEKIIEAVNNFDGKWSTPWKCLGMGGMPSNLVTKKSYRGINSLMLAVQSMSKGYTRNMWATFNQIKSKGGMVRKGEKSTGIIFFKSFTVQDKKSGKDKTIPYARFYNVFNVEQADGLKLPEVTQLPQVATIEKAEKVVADYLTASGVTLRHGGDRAFYHTQEDFIQLPERGQFKAPEDYYLTAFHEMAHSTGIPTRLDREGFDTRTHFGDAYYSQEELVAEVSASFLAASLGIVDNVPENQVAYLKGWLSRLKENPMALPRACSAATKAVDFILGGAEAAPDQECEAGE